MAKQRKGCSLGPRWIGLGKDLWRTGRASEGRIADTSAVVEVETRSRASMGTMAMTWRIMKSSPLEVHRAARRKVGWERVSPPLVWCRGDSVDRDGQRRQ